MSGQGPEVGAFYEQDIWKEIRMLKAGVSVSQGSFLKYMVFDFRVADSPSGRAFHLGAPLFPRVPGETSSLPTYRIHRHICFSLLERQNNQLSARHLFHVRTFLLADARLSPRVRP